MLQLFMYRIRNSTVMIAGLMTGVAHEIVKNLVLKGIGRLILITWDTDLLEDGGMILFGSGGNNVQTAERVIELAGPMNPTVDLSHHHLTSLGGMKGLLDEVKMFILVNETRLSRVFELNETCHSHDVPFQWLITQGMNATLVSDFGEHEFVIESKKVVDGETVTQVAESKQQYCKIQELWETHLNTEPVAKQRKAFPVKYSACFKDFQTNLQSGKIVLREEAAVNSIIGAISSQETIKVVTKRDLPIHNVVMFDGNSLNSTILSIGT